jgi:uncharacterized protein
MMTIAKHDPEAFRQRYFALMEEGRSKISLPTAAALAARNPTVIPDKLIKRREIIPGGWYWSVHLSRGETLRIVNTAATPGVSAVFWNADDRSERFNVADTIKIQWSAHLGKGRVLFSDMGRVLASITDDTCEAHDPLVGASSKASNSSRYGEAGLRNSRDNFILAASKHGMDRRDVPPCITFFAGLAIDERGRFAWRAGNVRPGDYVDLRAEMNVLAALSNCPHPLAPGAYDPLSIEAIIWQALSPVADDLCRTYTAEAKRGFENTDGMFCR